MKFNYKKILIIGCGGSGKSTLARQMGEKFALPVVHLDKIYWLPNWVEKNSDQFDKELLEELQKEKWILDGNFTRTFKTRLSYADLCIFLDYSTDLCLQSVFERVKKYKGKTRPDMTEGCPEQADEEFIDWIKSYNDNVKPEFLEILKNSNVPYLIFNSRTQPTEWLNSFD